MASQANFVFGNGLRVMVRCLRAKLFTGSLTSMSTKNYKCNGDCKSWQVPEIHEEDCPMRYVAYKNYYEQARKAIDDIRHRRAVAVASHDWALAGALLEGEQKLEATMLKYKKRIDDILASSDGYKTYRTANRMACALYLGAAIFCAVRAYWYTPLWLIGVACAIYLFVISFERVLKYGQN